MPSDTINTLVKILRDRDLPYDLDALKAAFANPESQTAIQAWVEEYLSPETLLTRDELNAYASLSKTGHAETLVAQDLSLVHSFNEQEIQLAIEELNRSTIAIEKQAESLKLQQNAMKSLMKTETRTNQARSHADKSQFRKWDVERVHISAAIEELSQSLLYQAADLEQQSKASDTSVKQTVDSIFKSDDKLLLSLQKLASDLEPGRPEDDSTISRIRELCARLIKHTVEGIRTRLDRIYLEALNASSTPDSEGDSQEVNDLQEELESLYSEIFPVAQMSVEQQYLEPALKQVAASDGKSQERTVNAVRYINECLVFLINRIETFLARAEESQSHKMALQYILDAAKKELTSSQTESSKPASPMKPNTQRRRKSSTSQSVLKVRNTRRSSGHDEDLEPELQLARNLGISLPAEEASDRSRVDIMEKILFERLSRLEGHVANLQSTTESSISTHLLDAHNTLDILQDSLLRETQFHTVRLVDPELESTVDTFEQEIQALQNALEGVDLYALQSKNVHREHITERWSR